jgi:hypothetical protein
MPFAVLLCAIAEVASATVNAEAARIFMNMVLPPFL